MAALLSSCPCSRLSFPSKSYSNGPRAGHFERSRAGRKLPWNPISLRCHNGNVESSLSQNSQESPEEELQAKSSGVGRRHVSLGLLVAALSLPSLANRGAYAVTSDSPTPATVATAVQVDEINAYAYSYPVGVSRPPYTIKWVESRKPERYSSAAPLTPDARQRIVSERLNFKNNLVVSVSVGPPNSVFLKDTETNAWGADAVARSVLADKSTARMTTGQRVAEVSILDTNTEEKDGIRYWYYEYVVQKSPTANERGLDVFRHSLAVTAEREGYLYTLNTSTSSKNWNRFSPMFKESVSSFQLLPPTSEYVPPYKDPWRFW